MSNTPENARRSSTRSAAAETAKEASVIPLRSLHSNNNCNRIGAHHEQPCLVCILHLIFPISNTDASKRCRNLWASQDCKLWATFNGIRLLDKKIIVDDGVKTSFFRSWKQMNTQRWKSVGHSMNVFYRRHWLMLSGNMVLCLYWLGCWLIFTWQNNRFDPIWVQRLFEH